ncbi:MAG: FHA domain-containing protein [Chloroflexota bacterium]|nr:FHA domain-containing protein [Chloroflexota bacterium]
MAAPVFQLTMRSGPTPGKVFPLEQQEILLGRDLANEIAISDPEVSRRHARFLLQEENVIIEDLGSTNGTFLNGQRISSPQQLRAGDVITFGENIVVVFNKSDYDPDATVVSTGMDRTVQPEAPKSSPPQAAPTPQPYRPAPEAPLYEQPSAPSSRAQQPPVKEKKGLPSWLIILIVAIVVVACVIAVTLYFMPASWWCAITFNMLEGCPIP